MPIDGQTKYFPGEEAVKLIAADEKDRTEVCELESKASPSYILEQGLDTVEKIVAWADNEGPFCVDASSVANTAEVNRLCAAAAQAEGLRITGLDAKHEVKVRTLAINNAVMQGILDREDLCDAYVKLLGEVVVDPARTHGEFNTFAAGDDFVKERNGSGVDGIHYRFNAGHDPSNTFNTLSEEELAVFVGGMEFLVDRAEQAHFVDFESEENEDVVKGLNDCADLPTLRDKFRALAWAVLSNMVRGSYYAVKGIEKEYGLRRDALDAIKDTLEKAGDEFGPYLEDLEK